jgi:hypothetical protein
VKGVEEKNADKSSGAAVLVNVKYVLAAEIIDVPLVDNPIFTYVPLEIAEYMI